MASPQVTGLMTREFVPIKLDFDRATGAKDIEKRFTDKEQGLPWFAFVDAETGRAVVTSTGPKGNVGFPWEPHEIAHFKTMLETAKRHLTDDDIAQIAEHQAEDEDKGQGGKGGGIDLAVGGHAHHPDDQLEGLEQTDVHQADGGIAVPLVGDNEPFAADLPNFLGGFVSYPVKVSFGVETNEQLLQMALVYR